MKRRLKKRYKRLLFVIILFLVIFFFVLLILNFYNKYRIKHALVHVELIENLDIEVYSKIKLSDLIREINGELIEDSEIKYVNEENITVPYSFEINIVDKTKPIISQYNSKTIFVGDKDFKDTMFCGDNYDNKPKCIIKGEYDVNTPGTYPLTFVGVDSSNNISSRIIPSSSKNS